MGRAGNKPQGKGVSATRTGRVEGERDGEKAAEGRGQRQNTLETLVILEVLVVLEVLVLLVILPLLVLLMELAVKAMLLPLVVLVVIILTPPYIVDRQVV
jgi:hypothetical protein